MTWRRCDLATVDGGSGGHRSLRTQRTRRWLAPGRGRQHMGGIKQVTRVGYRCVRQLQQVFRAGAEGFTY
jgi:hypothetical protein